MFYCYCFKFATALVLSDNLLACTCTHTECPETPRDTLKLANTQRTNETKCQLGYSRKTRTNTHTHTRTEAFQLFA